MSLRTSPSSACIVSPDTSIAVCVRAMRDRGYGAILVSDPTTKGLGGIFTERDLLKWVNEIQVGGHWDKPVLHLMSRPVHTISLEELDEAPRIMIERNIRHLPVVYTNPDTGETLISMVSMRDILRDYVSQNRTREEALKKIRVGVITASESIHHLIHKVCVKRGNASIERIALGQSETDLDFLVVDIDSLELDAWTKLLKKLNLLAKHPEVILIYSPELQEETTLEIIRKLGLSGRFSAFMKPLNLFGLISRFKWL